MIDEEKLRKEIQDRLDIIADTMPADEMEEQYIAGEEDAYRVVLNLLGGQ